MLIFSGAHGLEERKKKNSAAWLRGSIQKINLAEIIYYHYWLLSSCFLVNSLC